MVWDEDGESPPELVWLPGIDTPEVACHILGFCPTGKDAYKSL